MSFVKNLDFGELKWAKVRYLWLHCVQTRCNFREVRATIGTCSVSGSEVNFVLTL